MSSSLDDSASTYRLRIVTAVCSLLFAICAVLHNYVILDIEAVQRMLILFGRIDPAREAPEYLDSLRMIGNFYIGANAIGILAFWSGAPILYLGVIVVNMTQAVGWLFMPSTMWTIAFDTHGIAGVLPYGVTQVGAVALAVIVTIALVKHYRGRRSAGRTDTDRAETIV